MILEEKGRMFRKDDLESLNADTLLALHIITRIKGQGLDSSSFVCLPLHFSHSTSFTHDPLLQIHQTYRGYPTTTESNSTERPNR